jgi:conjugative transfer signal peptidase TraF
LCATTSTISTPGRKCPEAGVAMVEPAQGLHPPGFASSAAAVFVLALAGTLFWRPRPFLVWNASPSSPVGLYAVSPGNSPRAGETVIAWPPPAARRLAASRNYLPSGVPLVKFAAAVSGGCVCARLGRIFVNGRSAALRRTRDPSGRPMPWWSGCKRLEKGDLFLLSSGANAFDGRYFGLTKASEVIGRARLLWRR